MFQIFAQGPAKYAGLKATQKGCTTGIKAVFDWWCANGVLLGGEKDLKDVAAQVAETIASAIYEPDTTAVCMQELMPYMAQKSCGTPAQGTMYTQTAPRSRKARR